MVTGGGNRTWMTEIRKVRMRLVAAADGGNLIWKEKRIERVRIRMNDTDDGLEIQLIRVVGVRVWPVIANGGNQTWTMLRWHQVRESAGDAPHVESGNAKVTSLLMRIVMDPT
jgi:hypothetical protein